MTTTRVSYVAADGRVVRLTFKRLADIVRGAERAERDGAYAVAHELRQRVALNTRQRNAV